MTFMHEEPPPSKPDTLHVGRFEITHTIGAWKLKNKHQKKWEVIYLNSIHSNSSHSGRAKLQVIFPKILFLPGSPSLTCLLLPLPSILVWWARKRYLEKGEKKPTKNIAQLLVLRYKEQHMSYFTSYFSSPSLLQGNPCSDKCPLRREKHPFIAEPWKFVTKNKLEGKGL